MKFKLESLRMFFPESEKEEMEKLEELGFVFNPPDERFDRWYLKGKVFVKIDFDTIEDLMNFIAKYGDIIVSKEEITIFNDYDG